MKILPLLFLLLVSLGVSGQQLKGVQQTGMRVNADEIKIDGDITEWGHTLNEYNNTCEISYSVGNDRNYIFLAVRATDRDIINKIVWGGLAFTTTASGDKKDKNNIVITFPVYEKGTPNTYLGLEKITEIKPDAAGYNNLRDSVQHAANKQLRGAFKFISTTGIKEIADGLLSIYNDKGIEAAAAIDNSLTYNFEMRIPLKLLNITPDSKSIVYNIRLNGPAYKGSNLRVERDRFLVFDDADGKRIMMGDATPRNWSLASPTDFWGEYVLAK